MLSHDQDTMNTLTPSDMTAESPNTLTDSDSAASPGTSRTLRSSVEEAMRRYFDHLDGEPASNLYQMVLAEVEAPLLEAVMQYTKDNQSQASEILGLNRGTLRKKLKTYGML